MPSALAIVTFVFSRAGRLGKLTLAISNAEPTNDNESRRKAALVPNHPATNPPRAAPRVNIADHVTEAIALAGINSRSDTIEGIAAVLAGSKKAEKASCITVSR